MSRVSLFLPLVASCASQPLQPDRTLALEASTLVIVFQYIAFDAADSRNTTSLSYYTKLFLFQHLARSTTRTKIQALCKITTSPLLFRRLSSSLVPMLLPWIRISWAGDEPLPWPLSVATAAVWLIWAFYTFRRTQQMVRSAPPEIRGILAFAHAVQPLSFLLQMFKAYGSADAARLSLEIPIASGV
jgi:hypothetical protein